MIADLRLFWWTYLVEIKSLKGWLYNKNKVNDLSKVITPPNDVINKEEKQELEQNDYNFANLILPDGNGDKYENAAKLLKKWQEQDILIQDNEENIYAYSESYSIDGKEFSRIGFISLIRLEDMGKGVLPHEKVLEKDIKDRVALISTTKADFGIPFVLYDDKEKVTDSIIKQAIAGKEPYIDFVDQQAVNHKLWKISDNDVIDKIKNEMQKYQCIIADGHHRYTSELKVREMLSDNEGAKYGLLCFVNSFNEGMVILPTNRVVFDLENVNVDDFLNKINEYFDVEEIAKEDLVKKMEEVEVLIDKSQNLKNHVFGVYCNLNKKAYLLKLKDNEVLKQYFPDKTDIYQKLDVNIIHKVIVRDILGITEEQQTNREHIDFIKGNQETMEKMKDGNIQFAFFINPPLMREVFLMSRAGEVMPQKSTYFFPKVFSGLVVYKF